MNLKITLIFVLIFVTFFSSIFSEELEIFSDEWFPYTGLAGTETEGFIIDIAREAFQLENIDIKYSNKPWSRCIVEIEHNVIDAVAAAAKEESPDLIYPEEEIAFSTLSFFVRKDFQWEYNGVKSLKNLSLGVEDDYDYGPNLNKYIEENKNTPYVQILRSDN